MIYEIVTPYDVQDAHDCHETLHSLFTKLAAMTLDESQQPTDPHDTQYEVQVIRWENWHEREKYHDLAWHDREEQKKYKPIIVMDLDDLTTLEPDMCMEL